MILNVDIVQKPLSLKEDAMQAIDFKDRENREAGNVGLFAQPH